MILRGFNLWVSSRVHFVSSFSSVDSLFLMKAINKIISPKLCNHYRRMFVAEAVADFSYQLLNPKQQEAEGEGVAETERGKEGVSVEEKKGVSGEGKEVEEEIQKALEKQDQGEKVQDRKDGKDAEQPEQEEQAQQAEEAQAADATKRPRPQDHQQELAREEASSSYITFKAGDKVLVRQTDQSGWWYGNRIGDQQKGFFPSTFVLCGTKAPLPVAPPQPEAEDWLTTQMEKIHQGPIQSQYYQGIIGHKLVKIDDKNKNLLKANYVKFNPATGLASVPIKSQAPTAKAIRQMGYYFDLHEWMDKKNNEPEVRARPDIRKKKKKRLNLVLFGDDRERANQKKRKE